MLDLRGLPPSLLLSTPALVGVSTASCRAACCLVAFLSWLCNKRGFLFLFTFLLPLELVIVWLLFPSSVELALVQPRAVTGAPLGPSSPAEASCVGCLCPLPLLLAHPFVLLEHTSVT